MAYARSARGTPDCDVYCSVHTLCKSKSQSQASDSLPQCTQRPTDNSTHRGPRKTPLTPQPHVTRQSRARTARPCSMNEHDDRTVSQSHPTNTLTAHDARTETTRSQAYNGRPCLCPCGRTKQRQIPRRQMWAHRRTTKTTGSSMGSSKTLCTHRSRAFQVGRR